MILTPEQIDCINVKWMRGMELEPDVIETLQAYADIVQRVAEDDCDTLEDDGAFDVDTVCFYCGCLLEYEYLNDGTGRYNLKPQHDHEPDCIYIAARKLRGLE